MIEYQSNQPPRSFPNYQFHLLHYITFVEQKVMIQLGGCQDIFFSMISHSSFHSSRACSCLRLRPLSSPFSSLVFLFLILFGIPSSRLPAEIKWPCPLLERVSPMNPLLQEVRETGSCFTDFFAAVAGHPKEAGRLEWLFMWPLLAVLCPAV